MMGPKVYQEVWGRRGAGLENTFRLGRPLTSPTSIFTVLIPRLLELVFLYKFAVFDVN